MGDGFHYTDKEKERAVLVAIITYHQPEAKTLEYLDELAFLAETANIETVKRFTQKIERPDPKFYVGKGKLAEIKEFILANDISRFIVDDELTPAQVKNIENELKDVKIYDRSLMILDIFDMRARSSRARTQVELARFQYILPRLTRMWTHLERQRGGTGTRGGAGEKEIETDKRDIRHKITLLKEKLEEVDKQMLTQRKSRERQVRVSLVGYTNVGKSTLMNVISKSDVFAENKLFATLDSTVRKVTIGNLPFLLSDTVGFIRKLPHTLVECFKSTLDEIREADVLVHVIDISHPTFEDHIRVVQETLKDIKIGDKPTLMVFNKIDQYQIEVDNENGVTETVSPSLEYLKETYFTKFENPAVFISAYEKFNIQELRKSLFTLVKERYFQIFPNYMDDGQFFLADSYENPESLNEE